MSRNITPEDIEKARELIRPLIPLGMMVVHEVAHLVRSGGTNSQALEDSLIRLITRIEESNID